MIPGEVAAEAFAGDAAPAAEEGLESLVAAVDGVEVEIAATAFAGLVVERLVGEAQGPGPRSEELGGKKGVRSVTSSASGAMAVFRGGP